MPENVSFFITKFGYNEINLLQFEARYIRAPLYICILLLYICKVGGVLDG